MRFVIHVLLLAAALLPPQGAAAENPLSGVIADVLILGEVHDNPDHHRVQATVLRDGAPKAVVFEMLTPDEARRLASVDRSETAMSAAVEGFEWSNITDYAALLAESPVILGAALDRADMRKAFSDGAQDVFGPQAGIYGLDTPLDAAEQALREELQYNAHCAAMPREMMGGMVSAQRLRDAHFARVVVRALDTYGAPVALITGNGHARNDWGVPVYLMRARSEIKVVSLGQGEAGQPPQGQFDVTLSTAPAPERPDPCAAFK